MGFDAIGNIGRQSANAVARDIERFGKGELSEGDFGRKIVTLQNTLASWILREDGMGEREYEAFARALQSNPSPGVRAFARLFLDPAREHSQQAIMAGVRAAIPG